MNKLKTIILSLALVTGVAAGAVALTPAYAGASIKDQINKGVDATGTKESGKSMDSVVKTVINVMLYIIGALAVIMLVFGGIRYVTSAGNSAQVTGAKNTIMYSIVGLLIAIFAYAIVNFVVDSFTK